jgi:cell division protein FtsL
MARAATARPAVAKRVAKAARPARRRADELPGPRSPGRPRAAPARKPGRRARAHPKRRAAARPRGARILDTLLTGRACIAVVGVLLAGIVFFNVDLLQMNRDITKMVDRAGQLKRENARLRLDLARLASSERIQETAAGLGLVLPAPGEVRYLRSRPPIDAKNASKHISAPDSTYLPPDPATGAPDPTTGAPDPATGVPDPAAGAADPAATAPAGTETADPAAGGGYTSGPVDPATGLPVDPATGRTMYSPTGEALDPATGLPLGQG